MGQSWCGEADNRKNKNKECNFCEDVTGFYLGTSCEECNRPFRSVISKPKKRRLIMNYAIHLLEIKLEDTEAMYDQSTLPQIRAVYEEEIEDLELAIHNLKMLEPPESSDGFKCVTCDKYNSCKNVVQEDTPACKLYKGKK